MEPAQAREWIEVVGAAVLVLSSLVGVISTAAMAILRIRGMGKQTRELIDASHDQVTESQLEIVRAYVEDVRARRDSLSSPSSRDSNGVATENLSNLAPEIAGPPLAGSRSSQPPRREPSS